MTLHRTCFCSTWIGEEKERTVGGAVLSLFLLVTKRLYGKDRKWSRGQKKTCRKKQHVRIDDTKEMSDLIRGKAAVGGNYNSTRDNSTCIKRTLRMRSWLSVLITDAKSKKGDDIPIAPSLYSLSNKMDNSLLAVRYINHIYIVVERRKNIYSVN